MSEKKKATVSAEVIKPKLEHLTIETPFLARLVSTAVFLLVLVLICIGISAQFQLRAQSSGCVVPAPTAVMKTASYAATGQDNGRLIVMNCKTPCTLTLPSPVQSPNWMVSVTSIGPGRVTVSPGGRQLDGSTNSMLIPHGVGKGYEIRTDGADYFSLSSGNSADWHGSGPNPWMDIVTYGAVNVNTSLAPYIPGITANCSNGSTLLPISAPSTFVNAMGVAVQNCGSANTLTTPSAPTGVSSLLAAPQGSGYTVAGAAGGTETTYYKIVAFMKGYGYTAASAEFSVTGNTRGKKTTNLTSCVRSANTLVTCTTSAHTLATGAWVNVHGTSNEPEYGGWHMLTSAADTTHFAYQWSRASYAGATTVASTGGVVDYWQCNHIPLPTPQSNLWQYAIYRGSSPGAETFVDVSIIKTDGISQDSSYMTWDDCGTTYTPATNRPWYIPNTPPTVATNNTLVTTIVSGAGTTNLVLADPASQTVRGTTIVSDATPNYLAAFAAALANKGMVYVPQAASGFYATNTILDLTPYSSVGFSVSPAAWFGGTLVGLMPTVRGDIIPASLTTTQFSLEGLTSVTFNAKPGVYTVGGVWKGIAFNPLGSNTNAIFILGNIPTGLFADDSFGGASSSGDFASIPLYLFTRAQAGSSAAGIKFDNIFLKGNATGTAPLIMSKNFGEVTFSGMMGGGRGSFFSNCPTCTITGITFDQQFETQALSMPMYVTRGTVGLSALSNIEDTGAQPIVSHLGGGPLSVCVAGSVPSNGIPQVTGTNITQIACTSATDAQRGVNVNYFGVNEPGLVHDGVYNTTQPMLEMNMPGNIGPNYSLFTNTLGGAPAAPTCNVTTAGPPYSMSGFGGGTFSFAYVPIFANGGWGLPSSLVSCTMNGTSQQATIVIPAAIDGATSYRLFYGSPGNLGNSYTVEQTSLSILVPACPQFCQAETSPRVSGGGGAGIKNSMMWSALYQLSPTAFANLGTQPDGAIKYCYDCAVGNPCGGSGTGAFAFRRAGTWVCQ